MNRKLRSDMIHALKDAHILTPKRGWSCISDERLMRLWNEARMFRHKLSPLDKLTFDNIDTRIFESYVFSGQ